MFQAQLSRLALREGWEFSDLARTLIVLASTATWLGLEKQKNLEVLREIAALGRMRSALSKVLPDLTQTRRPYPAVRGSQETDVMTLILPADLAKLVETFAAAKMESKNDLCGNLLTKGLIMYLTAEQRLLQALQNQSRNPEETRAPKST